MGQDGSDVEMEDRDVKIEPLRGDNIVLIGLRGSGKTEVGKALASAMNRTFIDIDDEVEADQGKPISEIVKPLPGEDKITAERRFRNIETRIIQHFSRLSGVVIAAGGGAVEKTENRDALRERSFVVWLEADDTTLFNRLMADKVGERHRYKMTELPLDQEIPLVRQRRHKDYMKTQDMSIDTSKKEVKEVIHLIEKEFERRKAAK